MSENEKPSEKGDHEKPTGTVEEGTTLSAEEEVG